MTTTTGPTTTTEPMHRDELAPSNNPLLNQLGIKALIDTGGLSALRGARAFARDMATTPRVPAMVEPTPTPSRSHPGRWWRAPWCSS